MRPTHPGRQTLSSAITTHFGWRRKENTPVVPVEVTKCNVSSSIQTKSNTLDAFFFPSSSLLLSSSVVINSTPCRLCGGVGSRGMAHRGMPYHQAVESIMWILVERAKKHSSGAVGVSLEAAHNFFSDEVKRWERMLSGFCGSSHLHHTRGENNNNNNTNEVPCVDNDLYNVPLKKIWSSVVERKAAHLRKKIYILKELGILSIAATLSDVSLINDSVQRDAGFQRMECIGDHNWGYSICHRLVLLFPEVNWRTISNMFIMDALRTVLESNQHLEYVFTTLGLDELVKGSKMQGKSIKFKADIVEAIAGELHMALWSLEPHDRDGITARPSMHGAPYTYTLSSMVRDCLYELFNIVLFCFMAKHSASLVESVMEFTRREQYMHDASSPYYTLCKVRHRRMATSYKKLWTLPSLPLLNEIPQQRKEKEKHYIHTSHNRSLSLLTNFSLEFTKPPEDSSLVKDVLLEKRSRRKTNNVHSQLSRLALRELVDSCSSLKQD